VLHVGDVAGLEETDVHSEVWPLGSGLEAI
jgi:hypothetical protein